MSRPLVYIVSDIKNLCSEIQRLSPNIPVKNIHINDTKNFENVAALKDARILVSDPHTVSCLELLQFCPRLEWLHLTWAGIESFLRRFSDTTKTSLPPKLRLTRTSGVFGPQMAEYFIGQVVACERKFFDMYDTQRRSSLWDKTSFVNYRSFSQLSFGILGAGDIGREIARCLKCFGAGQVWGLVNSIPSPPQECSKEKGTNIECYIDNYRTREGLNDLLSKCDYICNVLPSTSATIGLLSGDGLAACQARKPVFINIGRGDVIDEASLIASLDQGWISEAILDVFAEEPLPESSPLWRHPRVKITPHVASMSFPHLVIQSFVKNYERFMAGESLLYAVDYSRGY